MVEAAQVEPVEAEEEPEAAPATAEDPPHSTQGLSTTELHAELANLGMDMKGTKLKEALAIVHQWQLWVTAAIKHVWHEWVKLPTTAAAPRPMILPTFPPGWDSTDW